MLTGSRVITEPTYLLTKNLNKLYMYAHAKLCKQLFIFMRFMLNYNNCLPIETDYWS